MNPVTIQPVASELTFAQKVALFKATATDLQARNDFAASRAEVILPLLLQQSTVRNIFKTELLPPGADARYDIPFDDIDMTFRVIVQNAFDARYYSPYFSTMTVGAPRTVEASVTARFGGHN